jgi:hypothetical protein
MVLQTAALDPYEFVRDAYLQRRRNLIYDGTPPPDREFMDPPPAPKKSAASQPTFPSAAEPTGAGSILVSGDGRVPVQSALQYEAARGLSLLTNPVPHPAESGKSAAQQKAPAWFKREVSTWQSGEPLTPAQLDALEQTPQSFVVSATDRAPRQSTILVRLWRSLIP